MTIIIKIKDLYLEWSTIVDGPTMFGMSKKAMLAYLYDEWGKRYAGELELRLARAEKYGTSSYPPQSLADLISGNRAGPEEDELTADELYLAYGKRQPIRDGWYVPEATAAEAR